MSLDVFDLWAKIGFDISEYDKGLDEAEKKADGFGSKLGGLFKGVGAVVGAGLAAAATGATALVTQSVSAYGEYQQLVGGVETLFSNLEGTVTAAPKVLENAANAYKTAGMSANQYMETVTSFSAALIAGLEGDYQKAAEVSDMAISDMADNANKMGTSLSSIQLAYQGFSRQQYQLLDNLKLGYGGTKTEMERLLADAEKISGIKYDISNLSDVYNAIHVIQQELGIAGTTAKEANDTITGSIDQLGGAWTNLVAGFADAQADIPALINNVVEVAEVAFGNLLPVVEQSIGGVATFVEDIAPVIADKLPGVVNQIVPPLLSTANTVVNSLAKSLPSIAETVIDVVPGIITDISSTAISLLPEIEDVGVDLIVSLADGITDALPELLPAAVDAVSTVAVKLTEPDTLMKIVDAGLDLAMALAEGIGENMPKIADTVMTIAGNIYEYVTSPEFTPKVLDAGVQIVVSLASGLLSAIPTALGAVVDVLDRMIDRSLDPEYENKWGNAGSAMIDSMASSFTDASETFLSSVNGLLEKIDSKLHTHIAQWYKDFQKAGFDLGQWAFETNYKLYGGEEAEQTQEDVTAATQLKQRIRYAFNENYRSGMSIGDAYDAAMTSSFESQKDYELFDKYLKEDIKRSAADGWAAIIDDSEKQAKIYQSIPSEALRQMRGETAPTLKLLNKDVNKSNNEMKDSYSGLADSVGETAEDVKKSTDKVKKVLTFDTKGLGEYTGLGVKKVLGQALTEAQEKADEIAQTVYKAQSTAIENDVKANGRSLEYQLEQYEKLGSQFVEGSEQYIGAQVKIADINAKIKARDEKDAKDAANASKAEYTAKVKNIEDYAKIYHKSNEELLTDYKNLQATYAEGSDEWVALGVKIAAVENKITAEEEKNADARAKAAQEEADVMQKAYEQQTTTLKKEYDKRQQALDDYEKAAAKIYDEIQAVEDKYTKALSDNTDKIYNSFGLFDEVPDRIQISGLDLLDNLKNQNETIKKFYDDIGKLEARGVSEGLISELRAMGVGALDQIDALLDLSDSKLEEYDNTFAEKHSLSAEIAEKQLEPMKDATEKAVNDLKDSVVTLTENVGKELGIKLTDGMVEGIKEGKTSLFTEAAKAVSEATYQTGLIAADNDYKAGVARVEAQSSASEQISSNTAKSETTVQKMIVTPVLNALNDGINAAKETTGQNVVFNLNGILFQNMDELTQSISEKMQFLMGREREGYAGA